MSITLPRDYLPPPAAAHPPTLTEVVARIEAARNDLSAARDWLARSHDYFVTTGSSHAIAVCADNADNYVEDAANTLTTTLSLLRCFQLQEAR